MDSYLSREYSTDPIVEEIIAILEESKECSLLSDAYTMLTSGCEEDTEEHDVQFAIFVVQQIYDVCRDKEDMSMRCLLKCVRGRINKAARRITAMISPEEN